MLRGSTYSCPEGGSECKLRSGLVCPLLSLCCVAEEICGAERVMDGIPGTTLTEKERDVV